MSIDRLLMCKPTYFDVVYTINPWMKLDNPVDKTRAHQQWETLYRLLRELGVAVELIEPVAGLPDMTFSGDCGMVVGKDFLRSNFRYEERKPEADHYAAWMEKHGYRVLRMRDDVVFEGLGDVIYHDEQVLFGYGPRTDRQAFAEVRRLFPQLQVRGEVFLADDSFFHVALAAAFLTPELLLYYPPAFDEPSRALLARQFPRAISVDERDAKEYFVCNNIVLGRRVLVDNCSRALEQKLAGEGFEVVRCDMGEFKKSGGSLRCLVLKV